MPDPGQTLDFIRKHHLVVSLASGLSIGLLASLYTRHYWGPGLAVAGTTYYLTSDKQLGKDLMAVIGAEMDKKSTTPIVMGIAGKLSLAAVGGYVADRMIN